MPSSAGYWHSSRCGLAVLLISIMTLSCFLVPGLADFRRPREAVIEDGKRLFERRWATQDPLAGGDGLGPLFNAKSCVACHFQGGVGGSGTLQCNVLAFEVFPIQGALHYRRGVVHNLAIAPYLKESPERINKLIPIATMESIKSPALFGAGLIDRISPQSIRDGLHGKGVVQSLGPTFVPALMPLGRVRILPDGRIGKFGWKAEFATLEEFVAGACVNELGLSNPLASQVKPLDQPNYPDSKPDLNARQFDALCTFVVSLPRPAEQLPPQGPEQDKAARGKSVFHSIGCARCHTPDVDGLKGVYSDFLLHRVGNYGGSAPQPPALPAYPLMDEWRTPPLWGVADTAPYFHDGASPTLEAAIRRHGGDAIAVTSAFLHLGSNDYHALIAFLNTLKGPRHTAPAKGPGRELLIPGLPLQAPDLGGW